MGGGGGELFQTFCSSSSIIVRPTPCTRYITDLKGFCPKASSCHCMWSCRCYRELGGGGGGVVFNGRANGTSRHIQHSPGTPTTGLRERGNDTSGNAGRSGRQNAATRRNMRRDERVTVQGPVKKQQPDGMSHRGSMEPKTGNGGWLSV